MQKTKAKILIKKRKGVSLIVLVFAGLAIISLAALVIDLGLVFNCRYEFQKLIETTALASITDYEAYEDTSNVIRYPSAADIATNANSSVNNNLKAFKKSNSGLLMVQSITPTVTFGTTTQSRYSRAIMVKATAIVRTYFINLLGINTIKMDASAVAMHLPVYLKNGNILNGIGTYKDTDLRQPAGGTSTTLAYTGENNVLPAVTNINTNYNNIYGIPDGKVLSLGPGGYITLKLPATLVDGKGFDLQILTRGNASGYFVFAGNDADASDPYTDANHPGGGLQWVNISCTGTPIGTNTNGRVGSYRQNIGGAIGTQAKFYGSGYFDLRASCSTGYNANVKSAKYLKIIDDNIEDGFVLKDPENDTNFVAIPSFFPGQNSSHTPGVSIDAIAVEHHSKLITNADFTYDDDGDGLINAFENSLGLVSNGPSEGVPVTNDDEREFWGYANAGITGIIQDTPTTTLRIDYATHLDNPPRMYVNY